MSDFQNIKKRIYEENRIDELLDKLGCWSIRTEQNKKLFVAGLPDGDNERSVQIRNNEQLRSNIRSKGINGDIFHLISFIVYEAKTKEEFEVTLPKSKYWVCSEFGYLQYIDDFYRETMSEKTNEINYNKWLHNLRKERNHSSSTTNNKTYPRTILNSFGAIPYKKWLDEGLSIKTQKEFGVGVDIISERVTFPIFNQNNELIGVKGRYCGKNPTIEDKYKYLYIYPCNKSLEFFNLNKAMPYINKKSEVIIVEGAKTVMYLTQWGFKNSISIEGDSLSEAQINILKQLGHNIRFVFAWDKDKDASFIKKEVDRLKGRLKYSMFDKDDLLSGKDSPCDKGRNVWVQLYSEYLYKIN